MLTMSRRKLALPGVLPFAAQISAMSSPSHLGRASVGLFASIESPELVPRNLRTAHGPRYLAAHVA